jgi:hypothetical protein
VRSKTTPTASRMRLPVLIGVAVLVAFIAPAALAANRIYWTNPQSNTVSFANLDGSGGFGNLDTTGATVDEPVGVTIDPGAGKIYWANSAGKISFANLAGGGGGDLSTTGATLNNPIGLAIDPAAGKIYWANEGATTAPGISFAKLDGSGGGDLNTGTATIAHPTGVAVDPAAGKIFWGNANAGISFAFLDGGGGGNLATTGATVTSPDGVAIDHGAERIYWANFNGDKISFANLNGIGGGDVKTTGATVDFPSGVAIDAGAGKIYWTNGTGAVSFANLNGSGGDDLDITGSTSMFATMPALLEGPSGTAVPTITGGPTAPTKLGCTQGIWGADLLESLLYRAPQSFSFSWFKDGSPIANATSSLLAAGSPGSYRCRVAAQNFAGSSTQTSAAFVVAPEPPPPTASTAVSTSGFTASVAITCHGVSGQTCAGPVSLVAGQKGVRRSIADLDARRGKRGRGPVIVGGSSYRLAAGGRTTLPIMLNQTGRRLLSRALTLQTTLILGGTTAPPRTVLFRLARIKINHHLVVWRIVVGSFTTAFSVTIAPVPVGASVKIACSGGCPFGHRAAVARRSHLSLTGLFGKHHLRPGAKVTFEITAPSQVGERVSYVLKARPSIPKPAIRCLPPGSRRAVRC